MFTANCFLKLRRPLQLLARSVMLVLLFECPISPAQEYNDRIADNYLIHGTEKTAPEWHVFYASGYLQSFYCYNGYDFYNSYLIVPCVFRRRTTQDKRFIEYYSPFTKHAGDENFDAFYTMLHPDRCFFRAERPRNRKTYFGGNELPGDRYAYNVTMGKRDEKEKVLVEFRPCIEEKDYVFFLTWVESTSEKLEFFKIADNRVYFYCESEGIFFDSPAIIISPNFVPTIKNNQINASAVIDGEEIRISFPLQYKSTNDTIVYLGWKKVLRTEFEKLGDESHP